MGVQRLCAGRAASALWACGVCALDVLRLHGHNTTPFQVARYTPSMRLVSRRQAPVLMTPAAVVAGKGRSVRPISSVIPPV